MGIKLFFSYCDNTYETLIGFYRFLNEKRGVSIEKASVLPLFPQTNKVPRNYFAVFAYFTRVNIISNLATYISH